MLMGDDIEAVTKAVVDAAKKGDMSAARLILDRIVPPRRDRLLRIALPQIENPSDAVAALGALINEMARGEISPAEATRAASVIESAVRTGVMADLDQRLQALEKATQ